MEEELLSVISVKTILMLTHRGGCNGEVLLARVLESTRLKFE